MTNLFGVDVTKRPDGEAPDGSEEIAGKAFILREISPETSQKLEKALEKQNQFEKDAAPRWMRRVFNLLLMTAGVLTIGILKSLRNVTLAEGYRNAPILFSCAATAWVLTAFFAVFRRKRMRNTIESDELADHVEQVTALLEQVRQELKIPEDCPQADILMDRFVMKDGQAKHKDFGLFGYLNLGMYIFREDDLLCLASNYEVVGVPLSSLTGIEPKKGKVSFPSWNKEEPPKSEPYKEYKIVINGQGVYWTHCYSIAIRDYRGEFEVLIPNYELPVFLELTGLTVPETA